MVVFPHAKINLGLHIIFKRSDGYHNIETCFYPIGVTDILEMIPSTGYAFSQSGLNVSGSTEDNLCVKAYQLVKKDFDFSPVEMHLHKIIPMGAGLGGGSSDGACMIKLLNNVFDLKISIEQMKKYASQLGSDCSFFLEDRPMIGTGRGEILNPARVNLKKFFLILVKPDVHVSTSDAYAGVESRPRKNSIEAILDLPIEKWKDNLINDFEMTIFERYPIIQQVKEKLYSCGAIYSSMSGSGASVYGIFQKPVDLKKEFPQMFYWSGELK